MLIQSVKYSTNRNQQFQVKTIVYEEDERIYVRKEPYTQGSINHILQIHNNYELLKHSKFAYVSPKIEGNTVIFPFITGESLDSKLESILQNGEVDSFYKELHHYRNMLLQEDIVGFYETEGFRKIFGDGQIFAGMPAFKISNIDMNFDNLILNGSVVNVIDYEWVFDFPIPIDYVFYRSVGVFFSKYAFNMDIEESLEDFFKKFGINKSIILGFEELESKFVKYVGFKSSRFDEYKKDVVHFRKVDNVNSLSQNIFFQVFWDIGDGFNEENSLKVPLKVENQFQTIEIDLPEIPLNTVRIDPITLASHVDLKLKVVWNDIEYDLTKSVVSYHDTRSISNGNSILELLSLSIDPQIILDNHIFKKSGSKKLFVEIQYSQDITNYLVDLYSKIETESENRIMNITQENEELKNLLIKIKEDLNKLELQKKSIEEKKREIEDVNQKITSSFVWKLLRKTKLIRL